MNTIVPGRTGRGAVFLVSAQAVFLVSSYGLHMVLARLLGPAAYGIYGVVFIIVRWVIEKGRAVDPHDGALSMGADPGQAAQIKRRSLVLQTTISLAISVAYALASVPIAWLLADPSLVPYLQLSAVAILPYSLYSLWAGYLGGLHLFLRQAGVIALYGVLKMFAVCLLAYAWGVTGALLGLALAPLGPILVALLVTPSIEGGEDGGVTARTLLGFAGPFTVFAVSVETLTMLDLFLVKAFVGDEVAVGYYTAASTIARVPYFLFLGLGTAVLPSMARAVASGNAEKTEQLVRQALRVVVLVAVPGVAFVAVMAHPLIDLLYSATYAPAALQLPLLMAGMSLAALFRVCASVESGAGRERTGMAVGLVALAVGLGAGIILTQAYGPTGAALTNLLMGGVASALALAFLSRRHPRALPGLTMVRSALAVLPAVALAALLPASTLGMLAGLVMGALVYLPALWLVGELGPSDLRLLLALLPSRAVGRLRPGL